MASYSNSWPGRDLVPITPDDDNDLPGGHCKALRCLEAGSIVGITLNDKTRTSECFTPGEVIPCGFKRILEATTATLEAIY